MINQAQEKQIDSRRGGGWNRKPLEDHLRDGTYRADRHGPRGDGVLDWKAKPPTKITASIKSQQRHCRNEADHRAVRNGCRFNEPLAEHVCDFFRRFLRHSKGQWAGQRFELSDWQKEEIFYPLFGWVRPDGTRRFRRSYIEIPKKNYKSTSAAGIGLYGLCGDEEGGAEIYSLGADKDQARIVHNEAIAMVDASPELASVLKINRSTFTVSYPATNSSYKALAATPRGKHGLNIHMGIADELHEWFGNELWEAIKYGYRARLNPLQFVITNAGDDLQSICYKQREKAQAILDGTLFDDGFFPLICATDRKTAEEEIAAVKAGQEELPVARSCNPGLGHVIKEEDLLSDVRDAIATPSEMPNLMRLTYGVWEVGSSPWLQMDQWEKCADDFLAEDLVGCRCFAGLDLSQTRDMTAVVLVFPEPDGQYLQLPYFWLPGETIQEERKVVDYGTWVDDDYLKSIPGPVIEQEVIEEFLVLLSKQFDLQGVVYDPMYADGLTQRLEEQHDIRRIKFPQTIMHYAGPTAAYERLVIAGKLRHNRHPVLTWQAGHVQVKIDVNNNKRPVKPPSEDHRKIDGMAAGIMALSAAITPEEEFAYDEAEADLVFL